MAESKKKNPSKGTQRSSFHKGDRIVTTGSYDTFPKGTQGRVLDVDEDHQILSVQLEGEPGKDTESAIMEHPFSFFEKESGKGRRKSA